MGDRNITLFALHTHGDTQFGPSSVPGIGSGEDAESEKASKATSKAKSLFGSGEGETDAEATDTETEDAEESDGSLLPILIALVVLAGIAMAARKLRGGEEETSVDLTESDDVESTVRT